MNQTLSEKTKITRRASIVAGLAAAAGAAMAAVAGKGGRENGAEPTVPAGGGAVAAKGAGSYTVRFGEYRLTVLSDGLIRLPGWPLFGGAPATEKALHEELARWHEDGPEVAMQINALLVRGPNGCLLVDAGYGEGATYRAGGGHLLASLRTAGVRPEEVDTLLITHAHPDHFWGAMDGERKLFPRARHLMTAVEKDAWWLSDAQIDAKPETVREMVRETRRRLETFVPQATLVGMNEALGPGLRLLALPGHTAGQCGLELTTAEGRFAYFADAVPHTRLYTTYPDWHYGFDADSVLAVATRRKLLRDYADDRTLVATSHTGFPAFGYLRPAGEAFEFTPAPWRWE